MDFPRPNDPGGDKPKKMMWARNDGWLSTTAHILERKFQGQI